MVIKKKARGKIEFIRFTWATDMFYGRYENGDEVTIGSLGTRRLTKHQKERAIKNAGTWIKKPRR